MIRDLFRYLIDTSYCVYGMSLSFAQNVLQVRYELNMLLSQGS